MNKFFSKEDVSDLEKSDLEIKEQIKTLSPESQKVIQEVNDSFNEINKLVCDFDSEKRVREAGWTPQQAEDIAFILKNRNIQVGQIFPYRDHQLVFTPFKTVVKAQLYIEVIQNRILELTTVPVEIEVSNLKSTIHEFTSLSFFGLINLAFKRLFKRGKNG